MQMGGHLEAGLRTLLEATLSQGLLHLPAPQNLWSRKEDC